MKPVKIKLAKVKKVEMKLPKAGDRRQQIIEAATQVFGEKGFHQAKIEDIAILAGIGKGTVYEYFRSKEALLHAAFEALMDAFDLHFQQLANSQTSAQGKIRAIVAASVAQLYQMQPMINLNLLDSLGSCSSNQQIFMKRHEKWALTLSQIMEEGVAKGELRPVNTRIFAAALFGVIFNLYQPWVMGLREGMNPETTTEEIISFIMEGIVMKP